MLGAWSIVAGVIIIIAGGFFTPINTPLIIVGGFLVSFGLGALSEDLSGNKW